jgi:hypothetical protein
MHEVVIVAEFPLLFFWLACVSAAWLFLFLERHLKKKGLKLQLRTLHTLLSQGKSTADTCY